MQTREAPTSNVTRMADLAKRIGVCAYSISILTQRVNNVSRELLGPWPEDASIKSADTPPSNLYAELERLERELWDLATAIERLEH